MSSQSVRRARTSGIFKAENHIFNLDKKLVAQLVSNINIDLFSFY